MNHVKEILSILLIFTAVLLPYSKSFSQHVSFKKLGLDEGLSEIAGLSIQQDSFEECRLEPEMG